MFVARLCITLGKTRDELLTQMDSEELTWWLAVDRINPLPDSYWQAGVVASTMANCHAKKNYKPQDFMPRVKRRQTAKEIKAILQNKAKELASK